MNSAMAAGLVRYSAGSKSLKVSVISCSPRLQDLLGGLYVTALAALVACAEQNHQRVALLVEIHPVAGAIVNPQFADAVADRRHVAWQAFHQPVYPGHDACLAGVVLELLQPVSEGGGFDFLHRLNVVYKAQIAKVEELAAFGVLNDR